jgi:hypothetical protein
MAHLIEIKCNNPNPHLNEVDLDRLLQPATVVRGAQSVHLPPQLPERLVQKCRFCTEGWVVITREMLREHFP